MSDKPDPLAARRRELLLRCAEQRDQLALEVLSRRGPLGGDEHGGTGGVLTGAVGKLLSGRYKAPVLVASAVAGALLLKRTRGVSLERVMALWQTAQPLLAMVRKARGG
jgi:NAD(P)H-hydrate repair Nnr-like enzyme with NAD(P)H-hydrate dehydratase domain